MSEFQMGRIGAALVAAASLMFFAASTVSAAAREITVNFEGVLPNPLPVTTTRLRGGESISGSFTYDDAAPGLPSATGAAFFYPLLNFSLTMRLHDGAGRIVTETFASVFGDLNSHRITLDGGSVRIQASLPGIGDRVNIEISNYGGVRPTPGVNLSDLTALARTGDIAEFNMRTIYLGFRGSGSWGDCGASPSAPLPCETISAELVSFAAAAVDRCENRRLCTCASDEGLEMIRCGILDRDFVAIARIPSRIETGSQYLLSWEILPLTQLKEPVVIQMSGANVPKSSSKLVFSPKSMSTVQRQKVILKGPKELVSLPGSAEIAYDGRLVKFDTTLYSEQLIELNGSSKLKGVATEQRKQ